MTPNKQLIHEYIEGFRQGDHARILACLTDDVVWDLAGHALLHGKQQFDREIENDQFTGRPKLKLDHLVEEGDVVMVTGSGEATHKTSGTFRFRFSDAFVFRANRICRVESYVVAIP